MDFSHLDRASKNLDRLLEYVSTLKQENRALKRKLEERHDQAIPKEVTEKQEKLIMERKRVRGRIENILETLDNALAVEKTK